MPRATILSWLSVVAAAGCGSAPRKAAETPDYALPRLEVEGKPYRTPRAGEGFRTKVFGEEVFVQPRDRSSVSAWDIGAAGAIPGVSHNEVLPFASLYFWRHPDEDTFLRAATIGVYNEVFLAKSAQTFRPFEGILTLNSLTVPVARADVIDGNSIDEEELNWGHVYPGLGFGFREAIDDPGANDNMLAISVTAEPGFLYFDSGHRTAPDFIEPQDTFEGRLHLQVRLDAMERNLLDLPHQGISTGSDIVYAHRVDWEDWGRLRRETARDDRDYAFITGYMAGAVGVPFLRDDRHRLLASIHGGVGDSLDRFSAFRIGGGPDDEEYEAVSRPVIPGALLEEFVVSKYAVLVGEYRWEPIFFAYVSFRTSVAFVERDRLHDAAVEKNDDFLNSVGLRVTTGFFGNTRLQVDYNYNTGVIRGGDFGGHEVLLHLSGSF